MGGPVLDPADSHGIIVGNGGNPHDLCPVSVVVRVLYKGWSYFHQGFKDALRHAVNYPDFIIRCKIPLAHM